MTQEHPDNVNRRGFMKAVAATAVVAASAGAGAAYLTEPKQPVVAAPPVAPVAPTTAPAAQVVVAQAELSAELADAAAIQAENIRLQAALDAANRRIEGLEATLGGRTDNEEVLRAELGAANEQIGVMAGLVALYEQLDDVNMRDVMRNSSERVGDAVADLLVDIPTLDESIASAAERLNTFEEQIPAVEAGRQWLSGHLDGLQQYYLIVEGLLQATIEGVGDFLALLGEWFGRMLGWLPFGFGEKSAEIMTAMTDLLRELPFTIDTSRRDLLQPLSLWLEARDGELPLVADVIRPVREQVLATSQTTVAKANRVNETYLRDVMAPVEATLANDQAVRDQIDAYRQLHRL